VSRALNSKTLAYLLCCVLSPGCTLNIYHTAHPDATGNTALVIPQTVEPIQTNELEVSASSSFVSPEAVLSMTLKGDKNNDEVRYMDTVELAIQSTVDAYLNCYYKQANGEILKIFPNRHSTRYWVYSGQKITLPESQYFHIVADTINSREAFLCLVSREDVLARLPAVYQARVFQNLPASHFDDIYALYRRSTQANLIGRVLTYDVR